MTSFSFSGALLRARTAGAPEARKALPTQARFARRVRSLTGLALLGIAALVALASTGCPPGRYASCDNDSNCPAIDGGKLICYNLRCVECHYDGDCAEGSSCGANNTCEKLHTPDKEEDPLPPATSLAECAKRCKGNPSCGDDCRDRFKK